MVYILQDEQAEELFYAEDIDGFRREVEEDDLWLYITVEEFETEAEKKAFLRGLSFGKNEDSPSGILVLCPDNESDIPYIDIIKSAM